jgi:hypothetical protein
MIAATLWTIRPVPILLRETMSHQGSGVAVEEHPEELFDVRLRLRRPRPLLGAWSGRRAAPAGASEARAEKVLSSVDLHGEGKLGLPHLRLTKVIGISRTRACAQSLQHERRLQGVILVMDGVEVEAPVQIGGERPIAGGPFADFRGSSQAGGTCSRQALEPPARQPSRRAAAFQREPIDRS